MALFQIAVLIILMAVCIYLAAWFSGSGTAITNLNAVKISEMRKKKEKNSGIYLNSRKTWIGPL